MSKQGDLFDRPEGDRRRQEGMARVLANAPEFKDKVRIVIAHLAATRDTFTNDDVRKLAAEWGVENPHHHNAWGAMIGAASRQGSIEWIDAVNSEAVSRHAGKHGKWRKAQ